MLTADGSAVAEEIDLPRQITKGEKRARVIPIHDELKQALEALVAVWPDRVAPGHPVVFSERGRYGANGVAHWFKRIYQDAGLTGASSHSGRRTLLTNLATITDDGGQARAVLGSNDHTNILCHDHRIARPRGDVNPVFVSVH